MDKARASSMTQELVGKIVDGWTIGRFIDHGKSALVFYATRGSESGVVKVFDRELIERFGKEVQLERIARECALIGATHPNLIRILGGGHCVTHDVCYVAMEYFGGSTLAKHMRSIPKSEIPSIIAKVASAARFLESKNLAHRDIKPENIGYDPKTHDVKLLDLGVLRPIGASSLTDDDARPFIGTLRYSSPEYLLRQEEDTLDGWRAITFYQLGGVLHDLIVGSPLFLAFEDPFARLVNAVQYESPEISSTELSSHYVQLARNCLAKRPTTRLRLVTWGSFEPPKDSESVDAIRDRLQAKLVQASDVADSSAQARKREHDRRLHEHLQKLADIIRSAIASTDLFPPIKSEEIYENGANRVIVRFGPSMRHSLTAVVHLAFFLDWLEVESQMITVMMEAALLPDLNEQVARNSPITVYQGVFDSEALRQSILKAALKTYECAQEATVKDTTPVQEVRFLVNWAVDR